MSNLNKSIEDFLVFKESLGFSRSSYSYQLGKIDEYANLYCPHMTTLSKAFVEEWCCAKDGETSNGQRARMFVIRAFGKFLRFKGQDAYVLESEKIPPMKPYLPHLFTDGELRSLFKAMDTLPASNNERERTAPVLFRMMYCCAMRPQEPLALRREEVNLEKGLVFIVDSKRHTDRVLRLSDDLVRFCITYDQQASRREWFFSSPEGHQLSVAWSRNVFQTSWKLSGLGDRADSPRPYDLRHTAASKVLMRWVDEGKDIMAMIPLLQAHMGHKNMKDSLYYVHMLPDLLLQSSGVDWKRFDKLYPEVAR